MSTLGNSAGSPLRRGMTPLLICCSGSGSPATVPWTPRHHCTKLEGRCLLGNVWARTRTSPPLFAAPSSTPPSAALSSPPSAGKASPPYAAPSSPRHLRLFQARHPQGNQCHHPRLPQARRHPRLTQPCRPRLTPAQCTLQCQPLRKHFAVPTPREHPPRVRSSTAPSSVCASRAPSSARSSREPPPPCWMVYGARRGTRLPGGGSNCQFCVPMSHISLPFVPIFGVSCSCPHSVNLIPTVFDFIPGVSHFPLVSSVYL